MPTLPDALEAARRDGWSVDTDGPAVTLRSNTRNLFYGLVIGAVLVAWGGGSIYVLVDRMIDGELRKQSFLHTVSVDLPVALFLLGTTVALACAVAMLLFGRVECRLDGQNVAIQSGALFVSRRWSVPYTNVSGLVLHVTKSRGFGDRMLWQLHVRAQDTIGGETIEFESRHTFSEHLAFSRSESLAHVIAAAAGAPIERDESLTPPNKKGRPATAPDHA